jgi:hypothetical protein
LAYFILIVWTLSFQITFTFIVLLTAMGAKFIFPWSISYCKVAVFGKKITIYWIPFRNTWVHIGFFCDGRVAQSLVFWLMFSRSLFVLLLSFFYWLCIACDEMMMALYNRPTLVWLFVELAHCINSSRVDMLHNSDTIFWFPS